MATIPAEFLDLVTTKLTFAHLGTSMSNGAPQVTPVWFSFDGSHIPVSYTHLTLPTICSV